MILAVIKNDHYSKKELTRLKKKLEKLYVVKYIEEQEGCTHIIAYSKDMIAS
jgi:Ni2+-binding GTPase involved in maturation of urease and hydrogenase